MASLNPLRVRDLNPPEDVVPAEAWADVVDQLGDLVVAVPHPASKTAGKITIGFRLLDRVIERIRKVLEAHDLASEPWRRDADWWRG